MESSPSGSFGARVDKIFGSLNTPYSSPAWSLSDKEVEKREWRRSHNHPDYTSPSAFIFDANIDEFGLRSCIGLDSTLDNENEEDEYDKLAEGRENASDCLFMRDINNHGPYLNCYNVLPNSEEDSRRDPYSDSNDASIGVKECEMKSQKVDSQETGGKQMENVEDRHVLASADSVKLKSILKRKSNATIRSTKRVRFDPDCECKHEGKSEGYQDSLPGTSASGSLLSENGPRVPDYLINPSRYIQYSLDTSNKHDVQTNNIQASQNFTKSIEGDTSIGLPKSVIFIPRKKMKDADYNGDLKVHEGENSMQSVKRPGLAIDIAAKVVEQSDESAMVQHDSESETDTTCRSTKVHKSGRNYRTKSNLEDLSVPVTYIFITVTNWLPKMI